MGRLRGFERADSQVRRREGRPVHEVYQSTSLTLLASPEVYQRSLSCTIGRHLLGLVTAGHLGGPW